MPDLRDLREKGGVMSKDMIAVIQRLYPRYEKCLHSKVENGSVHGIRLRKDAEDAVLTEFSEAAKKCGLTKRKSDKRSLPCRIYCRVSQREFEQLQLYLQRNGYATTQDWVREQVQRYIKAQERKENRK